MDQHASPQTPRPPARRRGAGRGFPLFRVFGIQIRVDWSWLIIFALMIYLLSKDFAAALRGQPDWAIWGLAAFSVIGLFACVLAHELGHSVVAMRNGIQMHDITLFIFGGMARLRGEPRSPGAELRIALAGPAVTVVLGTAFWIAWAAVRRGGPSHALFHQLAQEGLFYLAAVNTALLVFNLIPGFPLDGGRVLRAILWKVRGNLLSATRAAAAVGKGFAWVLIGAGVLALFYHQPVAGVFHIFLGMFLAAAANQSVQHIQLRNLMEHFQVADAMQTQVVTVPSDLTLDQLVYNGFYRYHFKAFPVVDDGRLAGMITFAHVQQVPPEQWAFTRVAAAAEPVSDAMTVAPHDGLYHAFSKMGEGNVGRLAVVNGQGRLVGLVSQRDVMNLMRTYSELRPAPYPAAPPPAAIPIAEPVDEETLSAPPAPSPQPGDTSHAAGRPQ